MSKQRRAREILQATLAKAPEERTQFLREACQSDPTLIAEVEQLLASYERVSERLKPSAPEQAPSSTSGEPTRIGKYEVLERVGQGAMGVVYKARDPLMRRLVGIKTISADLAGDPGQRDRFYREAQSAGTLSHKNIITIYELGEQDGQPFIAMEFLSGEDLKSKLDRRAELTLEQRLQWMMEICEGLAHAHGKDVIHRDIKPGNVFVTREGEIKVLDFGLARLRSSVATQTGAVMGTPSYMSPEQVRGEKVDRRSDLFSAGATFYQLLTFEKPYGGESIQGVFFQILEKVPPNLRELNPWIPKELDAIVTRAMAKDLGTRYGSADEILADLRPFEASLPERKRELRMEALEALGELEPLLARYRALLEREGIPTVEAEEETLFLSPEILNVEPAEAPTLNEAIPTDYLGLKATISNALEQKQLLVAEISKLKKVKRLMKEAAAHEGKNDLIGALMSADAVLRDLPEHPLATGFVDRVSSNLGELDSGWKRKRVEELLTQAKTLFQSEQWGLCHERIERAHVLDRDNAKVSALGERIERHRDEQRQQRDNAKRADALVRLARAKLMDEQDPRACLTILSEALSLLPDHSAARELWERAQTELDQQMALAAAETAGAAATSATLAIKDGDLELATRELSRAEKEFPEHTEIPAIATQLAQAQEALNLDSKQREPTSLLRDAPKARAPRRSRGSRRSGDAHPGQRSPAVMTLVATAAVLALAGVVGWRVLQSDELTPPPGEDRSTTSAAPVTTTSIGPSTTVAPTTPVVPTTTTSAPPPTSSSVEPTSTISTTTTSQPATTVLTTTTAAVTTTTVPPAPTTIALTVTPREQILSLMEQYQTAYETLDVYRLGVLYPSVPRAVKNSFQDFESLTIDMEALAGPSLDSSTGGRTASAIYRIVQTIEPKMGDRTTSRQRATFQFAEIGSAWIILGVQWESE